MADIKIQCKNVEITPYRNEMELNISGVNINEVLSEFKLEDILNHIDHGKILEIIGKDKCKQYFDLVDYPDNDEKDY